MTTAHRRGPSRRTVLVAGPRPFWAFDQHTNYMKKAPVTSTIELDQEPIGIVISRGTSDEPTPTFSAYVWAPDPEEAEEDGASVAI